MWARKIGTICHFKVLGVERVNANVLIYIRKPMHNDLFFVNRPHTGTICRKLCSCVLWT